MATPKSQYLSKRAAADLLKLSVRRVMELSTEGKLKRYRRFDSETRRQTAVFRADDVARLASEWAAQAEPLLNAADLPIGLPPAPRALPAPSAMPSAPRAWLTFDESAGYSGLPASVLRDLVAAGRLPALDVGVRPGGRYRVRRNDLDALEGERIS